MLVSRFPGNERLEVAKSKVDHTAQVSNHDVVYKLHSASCGIRDSISKLTKRKLAFIFEANLRQEI